MNQNEIVHLVREKILSYKYSDKKSENFVKLAELCNVAKTTISNYLDLNKTPNPATTYKILKFFVEKDQATSIMKEGYSNWWKINGNLIAEEKASEPLNETCFTYTKIHGRILDEAQRSNGVTLTWIKERLGLDYGPAALDDLLNAKYLIEKNEKYHVDKIIVDNNIERLVERIKVDCENFPVEEFNKTAMLIKSDDLVTPSARISILKSLRKLLNEIEEAKSNPAFANEEKTEFLKISLIGNWTKNKD